jgi:hypothetical protein
MNVEARFQAKYQNYLANFKTLSYDSDNDEHLCQDTTLLTLLLKEFLNSTQYTLLSLKISASGEAGVHLGFLALTISSKL